MLTYAGSDEWRYKTLAQLPDLHARLKKRMGYVCAFLVFCALGARSLLALLATRALSLLALLATQFTCFTG